jgi:hypothetical protein
VAIWGKEEPECLTNTVCADYDSTNVSAIHRWQTQT